MKNNTTQKFVSKTITFAIPVYNRFSLNENVIISLLHKLATNNTQFNYRIVTGGNVDLEYLEKQFFPDRINSVKVDSIHLENEPLGEKFDNLICHCFNIVKSDYIILLGSDDIISDNYLMQLENAINKGAELFALTNLQVLNAKTLKFRNIRLNSGFVGSGIGFSKNLWNNTIAKFGNVYPKENKGLDTQAHNRLISVYGGNPFILNSSICDIKTNENIWKYEEVGNHFPENEFKELGNWFNEFDLENIKNFSYGYFATIS